MKLKVGKKETFKVKTLEDWCKAKDLYKKMHVA